MPTTSVRLAVRWLSQFGWPVKSVLQRVWNSYEVVTFVITSWLHRIRAPGPAPIDPYQIYYVAPSAISRYVPTDFDFLRDTGRVIDGGWDEGGTLFVNDSPYVSFYDHFVEDVEWPKTDLFRRRARRIRAGNSDRYISVDELEAACDRYDRIYKDIAENGYRTQRELLKMDSVRGLGNGGQGIFTFHKKAAVRHEIAINIARDGSVILNDGRHRLAIALLLDIETIPVRIVVRHAAWQELRNRLYETAIDEQNEDWDRDTAEKVLDEHPTTVEMGLDHPDLQALLPTN